MPSVKVALPAPDQIDGRHWVYDIGENGDLSVDAMISDNVSDLVALFRELRTRRARLPQRP